MEIYVNLKDGTFYRERSGSGGNAKLSLNQNDVLRVKLWLMQEVNGPAIREPIELPTPYTLINLSAKATTRLDEADLLFTMGTWAAVVETFDEGLDTEYTETHYEADLDLSTTEIADVLDPVGGTAVDEFEFYWSLELSNGTDLRWTPVPRGEGTMLRDIYTGGTTPETSDPPYPAADQIAPISGANYQIIQRSGSWTLEIKNTTTGAFHKVTIEGASGAEQFVIHDPV